MDFFINIFSVLVPLFILVVWGVVIFSVFKAFTGRGKTTLHTTLWNKANSMMDETRKKMADIDSEGKSLFGDLLKKAAAMRDEIKRQGMPGDAYRRGTTYDPEAYRRRAAAAKAQHEDMVSSAAGQDDAAKQWRETVHRDFKQKQANYRASASVEQMRRQHQYCPDFESSLDQSKYSYRPDAATLENDELIDEIAANDIKSLDLDKLDDLGDLAFSTYDYADMDSLLHGDKDE